MRIGRNIQKRGDEYRFRARLPRPLDSFIGRKEISVRLATCERRTALRRARVLSASLETLVTDLPRLTQPQIEARVRAWIDRARAACERGFLETGLFILDAEQIEAARAFVPADLAGRPAEALSAADRALIEEERQRREDEVVELDRLLSFAYVDGVAKDAKAEIAKDLARGGPPRSDYAKAVDAVMAEAAPDIDRLSVEGKTLARAFLRGVATLIDEKAALMRGEITPIPAAADLPPPPARMAPEPAFLLMWDEFCADKVAREEWTKATAYGAKASRRLFADLVPGGANLAISRVNAAVAQALHRALLRLPSKYEQANPYRGRPLRECIEMADTRDAQAKSAKPSGRLVERLSPKTAAKHYSNYAEFFAWHQQGGRIAKAVECPFSGYVPKKKSKLEAREGRKQWPADLELKLFTSPVWTGCKSIHRRGQPGEEIHRDALFWAPVFARVLGVREDEICSRHVCDVVLETDIKYPPDLTGPDSIWYLRIRDSKTPGSDRDLPLPKLILDMGFLEYRVLGRAPDEPLFPELVKQGVAESRAAALSGRFTDYRHRVGVYAEKTDFHSLRASFTTSIGRLSILNPAWGDELTGHTSRVRESVRGLYTKGVLLSLLKTIADQVRFHGDDRVPRFDGPRGVQASGSDLEITRFAFLAEREMAKKAGRRKSAEFTASEES